MGPCYMPLYCVPLFIALVGPYYMYCIRMLLALNHILGSRNSGTASEVHPWLMNPESAFRLTARCRC